MLAWLILSWIHLGVDQGIDSATIAQSYLNGINYWSLIIGEVNLRFVIKRII
jgi:hypothetical protein